MFDILYFTSSQEVNIEFEAHSISDNDYNGIRKLLQQVLWLLVSLVGMAIDK